MTGKDTNFDAAGTFFGRLDVFSGLTIDLESEPNATAFGSFADFDQALFRSVALWQQRELRGLWLRIPAHLSHLLPIAQKHKFQFHHCEPSQITLTRWLPETEESKLPEYSSHYLGCGGVVVDLEKREILLICEKYQMPEFSPQLPVDPKTGKPHLPWKVPGGTLDRGEDLDQTAIREVFEETGVQTEFVCVVGFRHMHNFRFGQGDIYFVCLLTPKGKDLNPDPREIGECRWASLDEYFGMTHLNRVQTEAQKSLKALLDSHDYDLDKIRQSTQVINKKDVTQWKNRGAAWFSTYK